jgi:hypothetical protein
MRRWLLLLIAACGSDGGGSVSYDQFAAQFDSAYCEYEVRCGLFPDQATCESANNGLTIVSDPSVGSAIAAGKIVFDGAAASRCLSEFAASSCDQTQARQTPADCLAVAHGTVGSGGACAASAECISQVCEIPSCSMACCQGTCLGDAPPSQAPTNGACVTSSQCVAGDYCDLQTSTCQPFVAAGSACSEASACPPGYGCAGQPQVCKVLPGTGSACPDHICADVGDHCNGSGVCVHDGLPGDACTSSSDCSPFYQCDPSTMKCASGPRLGSACDSGTCFDAHTYCTGELGSAMPVCTPAGSDGAPCEFTDQCLSGHCNAGVCATPAVCF